MTRINNDIIYICMGQITGVWLSCYLVLLSNDNKHQVTKTAAPYLSLAVTGQFPKAKKSTMEVFSSICAPFNYFLMASLTFLFIVFSHLSWRLTAIRVWHRINIFCPWGILITHRILAFNSCPVEFVFRKHDNIFDFSSNCNLSLWKILHHQNISHHGVDILAEFDSRKYENDMIKFSSISHPWNGAGSWNWSSWKILHHQAISCHSIDIVG